MVRKLNVWCQMQILKKNFMSKNMLDTWLNYVSNQDLESVVSLYAHDAVLLGTYSNTLSAGHDQIKSYFIDFLSKRPKASLVESITHHLSDNLLMVNGFYNFNIKNSDTVAARFTFVFKTQEDTFKIISHHSSIMP